MLRLKTLGGLSLEREGVPMEGRATQRRRLGMLAYLAAAGPTGREKLIALLWPERDAEHGRHSLSQAVYALRQQLGADAILGGTDEIRLNESVVGSDIGHFRAACAADDLESAVSLYRGPFLDAIYLDNAPEFERWVEEERQRLAAACADALDRLGASAAALGDHHAAAQWRRQRLAMLPLDPGATLRLMKTLVAAGDHAGAIRQARIHQELLRADLDVGPDPGVAALAESLRAAATSTVPGADDRRPGVAEPEGNAVVAHVPVVRTGHRSRAALFAVLIAVIVGAGWLLHASGRMDAALEPPLVLVAEFSGSDSTLALAVREAIRAELAADDRIRLVTDGRLSRAVQLMRQPMDARVPEKVALDAGRRLGAHFVVLGSVARLGSGLQVVAQALNPGDGSAVISLTERAEGDDQVLAVISELGRAMRARLAATEVTDGVEPLPAVTTSSLRALELYALARKTFRTNRRTAMALGEAALAHDSLFALAHYLVGDLLWYFDQQTHSEAHMRRASALADQAPLRERLLIRARHEQLVEDRPDSALAYWHLLRASHPDDALAFEGMAWTLRALGRYREAAAAADEALRLDSTATAPNVHNQLYALFSLGDTTAALAFVSRLPRHMRWPPLEARYLTALQRHDWVGALAIVDSMQPPGRSDSWTSHYRRHIAQVALGNVGDASASLAKIGQSPGHGQAYVRSLIALGVAEATHSNGASAAQFGREALDWVSRADVSPQATARLAERIAAIGVWSDDRDLVNETRGVILRKDDRRGLRSHRIALQTITGCAMLLDGSAKLAAARFADAMSENFFGRSTSTVALLRADAIAKSGDASGARDIYAAIATHMVADTDFEAWPPLGVLAKRRLRAP
ncbi:MAG: BTAD domain-containing putative transcriptional regulator [Gemmatimonadaceae bacterium]